MKDGTVHLLLTDPPYYGIADAAWDNQWASDREFADWLSGIFLRALPKLTPTGSLVFFGGLGRHGSHPLFRVVTALEDCEAIEADAHAANERVVNAAPIVHPMLTP